MRKTHQPIGVILMETGLAPQFLKLEITESEIIENISLVLPTVEKLKKLGVQLSMDDFGTGYSSLSYLNSLPVDTLKIDRSFIQGIENDHHQLELVKTIVQLAKVFELEIVAEGIETEAQYALLKELKCKYGQGYLFSQPVDRAIASALID
ncbi:MAG: EAL domain-containing protein [Cyanobacteria bacterium J06600_6]